MRVRLVALFLSVAVVIAGLGAGSAAAQDAATIARDHLAATAGTAGLTGGEVREMDVADIVPGPPGVEIVYLQQRHDGLDVHNALATVAVRGQEVIHVADSLVAGVPDAARGQDARLSDVDAAEAAARALRLDVTEPFAPEGEPEGAAARRVLSDGGISREPIPVELVWQATQDGSVALAWRLLIFEIDEENYWDIRIDAQTGRELGRSNWIASHTLEQEQDAQGLVDGSSYTVFADPAESPIHTTPVNTRTAVDEPAWVGASPFGWHDTDGAAGAEFTTTQGNNVHAYTDIDDDDSPDAGSSPTGGPTLTFDFPLDLTDPPADYRPAAVTNLFYWNNLIHDVFHRYGFDEASGNFQATNYSGDGSGGDDVQAEAQDGGGTNNANFFTPPDGQQPRMQMYTWDLTTPHRDGDFDNGIIIHEYGHGISNRLTGGPDNVSCLANSEQGGEGWSDWLGLMMTMEPGDLGPDRRGIGTYALGQETDGPGIRAYPYSTDMDVDPRTYDDIKAAAVPHGVGSVWAAMLWEVTWAMIGQHGFDPDLIGGDAGNNIAIQLILDGMKLQPCLPGFVDARDAIIAADNAANAGENVCLLWQAFAKRGLGASAIQGTSASNLDGVEAFDLPAECIDLELTKTSSPDGTVGDGELLTYTLEVTNVDDGPLTGVVITDPIPAGTVYIPGSATCGGTVADDTMTFPIGTLPLGESETCSFVVMTEDGPYTQTTFEDDFDGALQWTASGGPPTWTVGPNAPRSAPNAAFAQNVNVVSDQQLTLNDPVAVLPGATLQFWHHHDLEAGYDGGVVEASTDDGTTWVDVGPGLTNGYNGILDDCCSNPLGGRQAFTGDSGAAYQLTTMDLAPFVGQDILVRFRLGTDDQVPAVGWWVDDVAIGPDIRVVNTATASATGALDVQSTVETVVVEGADPDLAVTALADPPATAGQGDSVEVTDTTANTGQGAAPASQTRYHLSDDATISGDDILLTGNRAIPALAPGGDSADSQTVTVPASTPEGTYRLIACADDPETIEETDEANNCRTATGSITITEPLPDLTVTTLANPPATAEPGDSIPVTDTTANTGEGDAPASQTRYHLSDDASISGDDILLTGSRAVPALDAGQDSSAGTDVTIPADSPDGSYRLIACADDTDQVDESDEANNCRTATGSITVAEPDPDPEPDPVEPDLVVSDLDDIPASAAVGSSFDVTDTTANTGEGAAGASRTRFYLSEDASIDDDDERLTGSRSVPALDPGEDDAGDTTLTVPDDVALGSYRLLACADDQDVVEESAEGNNCRATSTIDRVEITAASVPDQGSLTIIDPSADTAGNSRVAIEFAQHTIPDPTAAFAQLGSGEVLLASETVFADALASGALQSDRPLLLNDPASLEPDVLAEIQRLGATRVRILGGDLAISPAVADALTDAGLEVIRTFGPTRLETAQAIADLVPADGAFLARAFPLPTATDQTQAFADTLALGGWAAASSQPIYLTQTEQLSGSTTTALTARAPQQLHLIGGTAAISDATQTAAAALAGTIDRTAGTNRFATATAIATARGVSATTPVDTLIVIEGQAPFSWAAGFSAALLSAQTDAPVVLVNGDLIPDETRLVIDTMTADAPDVICSATRTTCLAVGDLLGVSE